MGNPAAYRKLELLSGNLRELYAVSRAQEPAKQLVPDMSGKTLYSASSWQGKSLMFFYNRFDRFNEKWRNSMIAKSMQSTHCLYYKMLEEAERHAAILDEALEARIHERPIDEGRLRASRHYIARWNRATAPFLKGYAGMDYNFKQFLHTGFNDASGNAPGLAPFAASSNGTSFSDHQKIIDFESLLGHPIPYSVLYKASIGEVVTRGERKLAKGLAKRLKRRERSVDVRTLSKFLRALTNNFERLGYSDEQPQLGRLAGAIAWYQHKLFCAPDPRHIAWRGTLKEGSTLTSEGIEVVLGKQVGMKAEGFDHNLIFEAANAPELVVAIGVNRLTHPLKEHFSRSMGFGLPNAPYVYIAENGSFALIEKLSHKLGAHRWTSMKEPIDQLDFELIAPVVTAVKWFVAQNRMPAHFDAEHLMYGRRKVLKCCKYTVPIAFSLVGVEDVLKRITAGNNTIFSYALKHSELFKLEHSTFFREVVSAACRGEDPQVAALSQVRGIKDYRYVDRAHALVAEVQRIKAACIEAVRLRCGGMPYNIDANTGEKLRDCYIKHGSITTLPHGFEEEVTTRVLDNLVPSPTVEKRRRAEEYARNRPKSGAEIVHEMVDAMLRQNADMPLPEVTSFFEEYPSSSDDE